MAYPGPPGQTPPPPGGPAGGYAYQLNPGELRYSLEIPVMIGTWAVVVVLLFLLGAILKVLIPLVIAIAIIAATLYFSAVSKLVDAIKVGPQQLPQLYHAAQEAAYRLSMPAPDVYINQSPFLTAEAADVGRKQGIVSLTTGLVEALTPAELQFMLARQFGHVKCRHTSWAILHQNSAEGLLGAVGGLLRTGLQIVFAWWNRTVELTADRAGLIGCQDIRAAITAILKEMVGAQVFARMNIPALLEQMQELEGNQIAHVAQAAGMQTQPFALNRIHELLRFYKSPLYQRLASRQGKTGTTMLQYGQGVATGQLFTALAHQAQTERDRAAAVQSAQEQPRGQAVPLCRNCHQPLRPGARFCGVCGAQQA